jgi:hypothetical protein
MGVTAYLQNVSITYATAQRTTTLINIATNLRKNFRNLISSDF